MSCACVDTAIIKEIENEKLRNKIKYLEKKVKQYQQELYIIYSSTSGSEYSSDHSLSSNQKYSTRRSKIHI